MLLQSVHIYTGILKTFTLTNGLARCKSINIAKFLFLDFTSPQPQTHPPTENSLHLTPVGVP
jgi:hypothetical protein